MSQTIMAHKAGMQELNPILGNSITQTVLVKSSTIGTEIIIHKKLSKSHPKAAKWTTIALSILYTGIVIHNARQMKLQNGIR